MGPDPTSTFDLFALAIVLLSTPPKTPTRNRSVEIVLSIKSGKSLACTAPTTTPSRTAELSAALKIDSYFYGDIDIIGYEGEWFIVEVLKQHLPNFQGTKH